MYKSKVETFFNSFRCVLESPYEGLSVHRSVHQSVHRSVRNPFFEIAKRGDQLRKWKELVKNQVFSLKPSHFSIKNAIKHRYRHYSYWKNKKNCKNRKKFFSWFWPLGGAPSGAHISAQGSNFKKRLDEFDYMVARSNHAKFHGNRPSSLVGTDSGSGNLVALFIIWSLL